MVIITNTSLGPLLNHFKSMENQHDVKLEAFKKVIVLAYDGC
jgi:hypothetical protein